MTEKNKVEETAVAVSAPTEVAVTGGGGRGFEEVSLEDISMPRAKLLQSNSPEVSDRDYTFRAGDVIHSMMMEKLPEKFIPLSFFNSNILFVPREDAKKKLMKEALGLTDEQMEGNIICRSDDGRHGTVYGNCADCGNAEFRENEKPWCNKAINVLALPVNEDGSLGMPVVYQFTTTSYKHGKKFRDMAYYACAGGDLFTKMYKYESIAASGNGNNWFEIKAKPAGTTAPEHLHAAEQMFNTFAGRKLVVEAEVPVAEREEGMAY